MYPVQWHPFTIGPSFASFHPISNTNHSSHPLLLIRMFVIRSKSKSTLATKIHTKAKHTMVSIASHTMNTIEVLQDARKPRIWHHDHRVLSKRVNHGLDRVVEAWYSDTRDCDGHCIGIVPNHQRKLKRLGLEARIGTGACMTGHSLETHRLSQNYDDPLVWTRSRKAW